MSQQQKQKDNFNARHKAQFNTSFQVANQSRADELSNTIEPLGKRRVSFPFRYLRTWIFSLLALVFLPIGAGLFLIGIEMEDNLRDDWDEVRAEVIRNDESGVEYEIVDTVYSGLEGEFSYELDSFLDKSPHTLTLSASACDLLSRFIIPKDSGEEFTLWIDSDKTSQQSCVPITRDMSSVYIILGAILMGLSGIRLLRTINDAALKS
ncbi:MAG: hypothetical protein Phog2KO_41400 [Phototrophicaceae bacterium]